MADTSGNTFGLYRSDRGYFTTGTGAGLVVYPIQEGAGLSFPDKYIDAPGTANNVYDVSYYNGLYYPTARVPVDVLSSWFTAANLNQIFMTRGLTRGERGYDDLSQVLGDPVFSDGKRAFALNNAKGAMLTISTRQNDVIRANFGVMGAAQTEQVWAPVAPPIGKRAAWDCFTMVSGASGVTDITLSIDNRCGPTPIFGDNTGTGVIEINAGRPRFTLTLVVDAAGVYPTNGSQIVFTIAPPLANGGAGTAVTFTIPFARINQPDNIEKRSERASQTFPIVCQSLDGVTPGLVIS